MAPHSGGSRSGLLRGVLLVLPLDVQVGGSRRLALLYLSLPYLTSLHLFTTLGTAPLVLPIVLIATEDLFEMVNWRNAFRAWLAFAVSVLLGDINILFSLAPIVIVYGGVYALVVRRRRWRAVQRALGVSAAIGVTAAAPLLLPLHANSKSLTTSPALEPFLPAPSSGVDVMGFLRTNGLDSLVWPFEGSGLLLYCPAVFVFLGLVGLCVRPTHEDAFRRRIIALVVLAISLFVETLILNNASFLRALGVADTGTRGILRVHLNLLPYLLLLIGVLGCVSMIERIGATQLRPLAIVAGSTAAISVGIDVLVLGINPTWYGKPLAVGGAAQVPSPTVFRFPRSWDPVVLLVGFHVVAALLLLLVCSHPVGVAGIRRQMVSAASIGVMAVVVTFGTLTAHLEMMSRSSAEWHWVTDSAYRVDAFRQRRTCIEDLADVNDPGVRVMYTGGQSLSESSGRAWANLLEVELSQESGQHTLFSYRELDAPVVGVYYGFLGSVQSALLFPPLTDVVAEKVSLLRLLGVRYVVSVDAPMPATATARRDFALLGTCTTATGPAVINGADVDAAVAAPRSGAGASYVYEVARSPGIFSFTCANEVMSQAAALSRASTLLDPAWERGVLWTEQPVANAGTMACGAPTSSEVQILSEDGSDVNLRVHADRSMALVAAYAFRDGWSAWLDGREVPMLRAYGGLMTISVPPGSHSVVFSYRSRTLPVGLVIFAVSGSVLLVGTMRSRRRPAVIETD